MCGGPMNEREAFLLAICENPDDDTPRLVFADWLQEHGDEARAEFIRVQIELARKEYGTRLDCLDCTCATQKRRW
jgi:uncharacterized protein (TIGR02996 family)